jgi:hypothetical protein
MNLPKITYRDAMVSADGKYRYTLERRWGLGSQDSPIILWCMLNPSTADAKIDDPTIRRCIGFSDMWGFSRMTVINLYAYRATNPRELEGLTREELEGPLNRWVTNHMCENAHNIVCAWGAKRIRCLPVPAAITRRRYYTLGLTKSGEPRHPLYMPADTKMHLCLNS